MISVIMPTKNPNKVYFKKAVESILNQTYCDFEFIIIDDGSDVKINNILEELNITDDRIIVIRNDESIGITKSLNKGIKNATRKYIARMDDDDISESHRLEKQLEIIKQNSVSAVFTASTLIDSEDNIIGKKNYKEGIIKLEDIITNSFLIHPSAMLNRQILINNNMYDENLLYAQDYDLWIRLIKKSKFYYINEELIKYRVNKDRRNVYKISLQSTNAIFPRLREYLSNKRNTMDSIRFYYNTFKFLLYLDLKERKNLYNSEDN